MRDPWTPGVPTTASQFPLGLRREDEERGRERVEPVEEVEGDVVPAQDQLGDVTQVHA